MPWYQAWGMGAAYVAAGLLCFAGVALSCLSLSGTWLVVAATVLLAIVREQPFPGVLIIIVYILISVLVEAAEFAAGAWGVSRRGGSRMAGVAAVAGGVVGLVAGTFIPIPILGNLLGMLGGSFLLAYLVEKHRLEKAEEAANIALGAVFARIAMILVKTLVTLGMVGYLFLRIVLES